MNQTYTVKAGDTLYGISNQFGVSVTELANLNNVNANTLQIGQVLTIPGNSGDNPNNMFMYTVKKGDTLYNIAKKYNTTAAAIIKLNYLKNTNLSIGQVLRIPETFTKDSEMVLPNYINYTVKKGDNIYNIAKAYNIDVNTLMKDNGLVNNNLIVGQNLRIRVSGMQIEECFGEDYVEDTDSTITYIVKKGDSLYSIAKKYNTSVTAITNLNNLKSNSLQVGDKLKIPSTTNNTYIVKSGDSLYSIARKFNTTVDNIKKKNNLTSNLLLIGDKLII